MVMRSSFDELRTTSAATLLLREAGGQLPSITLATLLYLADRRALVETGRPITGALLVSMPFGPVLSQVYEMLALDPGTGSRWRHSVSAPHDYQVDLEVEAPDPTGLSAVEETILRSVLTDFGQSDRVAILELARSLPEWVNPGESWKVIDPSDILRAEGFSEDEILELESLAESRARLQQLVATHS